VQKWLVSAIPVALAAGLALWMRAGPQPDPPRAAPATEARADVRSAAAVPQIPEAQRPSEPQPPASRKWPRPAPAAPAADLSSPYPFEPGQAATLSPGELLDVLGRFYGAALPEGWTLEALRLPGGGRFELDLSAEGRHLTLYGELRGQRGLADLAVEGSGLAEAGPLHLSLPLPPGVNELALEEGRALVNAR
jgi:hypothetical protein